jgi:hypothetical protein
VVKVKPRGGRLGLGTLERFNGSGRARAGVVKGPTDDGSAVFVHLSGFHFGR